MTYEEETAIFESVIRLAKCVQALGQLLVEHTACSIPEVIPVMVEIETIVKSMDAVLPY